MKKIKMQEREANRQQAEFAKSLGISQAHISKIEKNIEVPSKQLLTFIAYRYNVNIDWLENKSNESSKKKENTDMKEKEIAAIVIVYNDGSMEKVKRGMAVSFTDDRVIMDCLNMTQGDFVNVGSAMAEAAVEVGNKIKSTEQS